MGRGNVCVTGDHEGLFYIDNGTFHVYRLNDDYEQVALLDDIDYADLEKWHFSEIDTMYELEDIEECIINGFMERFNSFTPFTREEWISRERRAILENDLFYIALEDNEWSIAVELIQKQDPCGDSLSGLQSRHSEKYLEHLKKILLERLPYIGTYSGAWTSGTIRREDIA